MRYPTLNLVFAILLAGTLGGWMNYLLAGKEDRESRSIAKSLILGIGASFLVPLLLNMISSNLMESVRGDKNTPGDPLKLLVFAGICLVAAVSSTRFIQTISDRVLQEAQEAKKLATNTDKAVAPLVEKFTEQPEAHPASGAPQASLEEPDRKILRALADPKFAYRFTTGVSIATELPHDEVERGLAGLVKRGLAGRTVRLSDGQVLWYLTSDGRRVLSPATPDPEDHSPAVKAEAAKAEVGRS